LIKRKYSKQQMFKKRILDIENNSFEELSKSAEFEDIVKGRQGAVLVNYENELIPLIRTTSKYATPVQKFLPIHDEIMNKIKETFKETLDQNSEGLNDIQFNNAMIEIYDSRYRKMRFHTDQSLDLKENSYICLFSCYENASQSPADIRKLKIKNKTTDQHFEVLLENNSAVLFSTSINQQHLHKIILESTTSTNKWLGITFRLSKTFVKFIDGVAHLIPSNKILRIGTDDEKKNFMICKGHENSSCEYVYPEIYYTISTSDTMPVQTIGLV